MRLTQIAMLCCKCRKNEATVHLTSLNDDLEEKIDLCEQCAPSMMGFDGASMEQLKSFSVLGKNCEFCGKPSFSGQLVAAGGAIYWCFDCGLEFTGILSELMKSERPDLMPSSQEGAFAYISDPDVEAWFARATQKAVRMLKEKRQQDGGKTGC